MNRYVASLLIFFFFVLLGGLAGNVLSLLVVTGRMEAGSNGHLQMLFHFAGTWAGIVMGVVFAARRFRSGVPWQMTPVHKALVFGVGYCQFTRVWQILLFTVGEISHGGPPPPAWLVNAAQILDALILFPTMLMAETPLRARWGAVLAALLWSAVFYFVLWLKARLQKTRRRISSLKV